MSKKRFSPESLMMSYGYEPDKYNGAVKSPVFQTSTFEFESAEAGKHQFELAYGLKEPNGNESRSPIYSRLSNPTQTVLEQRLTLWDRAEDCAVFASGMAAITTVFMEFLKPGDTVLHSAPVYGGTDHFIHEVLTKFGITAIAFDHKDTEEEVMERLIDSGQVEHLSMIFIETPANPTNDLIDMEMCARLARRMGRGERRVPFVVDNTYMGPLWQRPLEHGADMVVYSATKYIGGHSDVIAGAVLGSMEDIGRVRTLRTFLGNMPSPWTSWLLLRSLETLKLRMTMQAANAEKVAHFLADHPGVRLVHYPGLLDPESREGRLFNKQCLGPGAMVSFEVEGGEEEAFAFLNGLELIKLAVSLGGTESLAEHPRTMTHAGLDPEHLDDIGVTECLVRLSIGVENVEDIISDINNALRKSSLIQEGSVGMKSVHMPSHQEA